MMAEDAIQMTVFRVAGRRYGVDIRDVKEICAEVAITPIYHAPEAVLGYMNVRGQIHLVADLQSRLGLGSSSEGPGSRVILFKAHIDEPFGVLADAVDGVVEVAREAVREAGEACDGTRGTAARESPAAGLYAGACPLEDGMVMVIDARAILPAPSRQT